MKKYQKHKTNELLLLSVLVLVILSAVVVLVGYSSQSRQVRAAVEGSKTVRAESSVELMKMLKTTVDDGGKSDFLQLNRDASGL